MNPILLIGLGVVGYLMWQSQSKKESPTPAPAPVPPTPEPAKPIEPPQIQPRPVEPSGGNPFEKPQIEADPGTIGFPDYPPSKPVLPPVVLPPKPPAKPVAANRSPKDLKVEEMLASIPAFDPQSKALDSSQAIGNYARNAIVSLLQNRWGSEIYAGTNDPSWIGESLYRQGWKNEQPRSPIIVQVWGIYDSVVGDAMRDKSVVDQYRKGTLTKEKLKTIMVTSPGNIVGTSERRFREATGG